MNLSFACADFTFPLLPHDRVLQLVALLDLTGVDIGLFENHSHLWPSREFVKLDQNARIHDIGKIGIPGSVLNNPGRLTDAERHVMEKHPVLGADLLLRYQDFARGVAIVRHHHERIDGNGYPSRLAGHDIPFGARVIAVADTWDALTSDRPYRRGIPPERAAAILCAGRGTQWSAELVDALLIALGYMMFLDNTRIADSLQGETAAPYTIHTLQATLEPTPSHPVELT